MSGCHHGYYESEICVTSRTDFCCETKENFWLTPNFYYKHNTPLTKVEGSVGVYKPWAAGDSLDAISKCEVDLLQSQEVCPASVCTATCGTTLIPPATLCWPAGTTSEQIEMVRCQAGCCLKLAQEIGCC